MKFKSLLDALAYQTECPFCNEKMAIDQSELIERLEYPLGHEYQRLVFPLSNVSPDCLYVSTSSEKVEVKLASSCQPCPIHCTILVSLNIACDECCQYRYTLKLEANVPEGKLCGTFLNSELVTIDEGDKTYEIRTVYATNKTEYSVWFKTRSGSHTQNMKTVELPLVPMDLKNPKETLARIQKLIIFS